MPILTKLKQGESLTQADIILILQKKEILLKEVDADKKHYVEEIKRLDKEIADLEKIRLQTNVASPVKRKEESLRNEYKRILAMLCEKESVIHHAWFYFRQLPYDTRNVLEYLYVEQRGWKNIDEDLHITKKNIVEHKNKGLNYILEQIESDSSLHEDCLKT